MAETPMEAGNRERREQALATSIDFAVGAIADAIYSENGLNGDTGEKVLCILAEAKKYGTFDERKIDRAEMLEFFHLASDEEPS